MTKYDFKFYSDRGIHQTTEEETIRGLTDAQKTGLKKMAEREKLNYRIKKVNKNEQ